MKIGMLTGGGDAPGLNAVIRGAVRKALSLGWEVVGFQGGWAGPMEPKFRPLDLDAISGILHRGGTILGTSRTNPFKREGGPEKVIAGLKAAGVDALVACGGEDTLGVASRLFKEHKVHVVGVPKTIDNDLNMTDATFGFDTAVGIATEALDRLHTTAESHNRCLVVEIMGRHAGWIALWSGLAGGADAVLIPEVPFDVAEVSEVVKRRKARGKNFSIIAVSEGAVPKEGTMTLQAGEKDEFGHVRLGGIADRIAKEIEKRTGVETRTVVLGHLQRGGSPSAADRVLGLRFGIKAVEEVQAGHWGRMVALKGTEIVSVSIEDAVKQLKTVPPALQSLPKVFEG